MEFTGILGFYQFEFDTAQCSGSCVGCETTITIMRVTTFNLRGNFHKEVETDHPLPVTHLDGYPPIWNITTLPGLGLYQNQGAGKILHTDTNLQAEVGMS